MSIKKSKTRRSVGPRSAAATPKPNPKPAPESATGAFFTLREHAILARYFGLQHLRPPGANDPALLAYEDSETWDEARDGIALHLGWVHEPPGIPIDPEAVDPDPGDSPDPRPIPLEGAVARIVLNTAADLPQWAISEGDGEIYFGRPLKKPGDRPARILLPAPIARINWATSGPGISWPEKYYITRIAHYRRWVVTASSDTSETTGFVDWAIHHAPDNLPAKEVAREALLRCWRGNAALNQSPFESIEQSGLLKSAEIAEIARLAWPGKQICDETYEELVTRTGFGLGQNTETEGEI